MEAVIDKELLLEVFRSRHACKAFDPERKIADDVFRSILEAGRLSPSSYGWEPWQFVVLQDPRIRERLRESGAWGAQQALPTASHFVLILAYTRQALLPDSPHIQHIMRDIQQLPPEVAERKEQVYRKFLESDFKLLDSDRALWDWAGKQAYIALANMMTAAALLGVDSLPIEGFESEPIERILAEEGIADGERLRLVCMAGFGYRVKEPRPKTRRPLDEVVTWR